MDNKKNVLVVFGGKSVEHDISIITGVQTLNNLNKDRYNVYPIYISNNGCWYYSKEFFNIITFTQKNFLKKCKKVSLGVCDNILYSNKPFCKKIAKIDFVFLAVHGGRGENGCLQGYLEMCNIPYSSCGVLQSAVGMDKYLTKMVLRQNDINCVDCVLLKKGETFNKDLINNFGFPVIVKPNSLGSSIGISMCNSLKEVENAVDFAFLFDNSVLIEKGIKILKEVNIAIIGNELEQELSDIEEVIKKDKILSFEDKYLKKNAGKGMENTTRVLPAKLDDNTKQEIEQMALKTYKILNCKGIIRFDFLIDGTTNEIFLNEFNTIPGSLSNYLWKTKKYNFSDILDKMYEFSTKSKAVEDKKILNFSSSVLDSIKDIGGTKLNK